MDTLDCVPVILSSFDEVPDISCEYVGRTIWSQIIFKQKNELNIHNFSTNFLKSIHYNFKF